MGSPRICLIANSRTSPASYLPEFSGVSLYMLATPTRTRSEDPHALYTHGELPPTITSAPRYHPYIHHPSTARGSKTYMGPISQSNETTRPDVALFLPSFTFQVHIFTWTVCLSRILGLRLLFHPRFYLPRPLYQFPLFSLRLSVLPVYTLEVPVPMAIARICTLGHLYR